jgi:hypothetical protein
MRVDASAHVRLAWLRRGPGTAIGSPLPRSVDAGGERAERFKSAARECQAQDRPRQTTQ